MSVRNRNNTRAIAITISSFFLLQVVLFGVIYLTCSLAKLILVGFFVLSIAYHATLFIFLTLMQSKYPDEDVMTIPNVLSALRHSSMPTIFFLLLSIKKVNLTTIVIPFVSVIFLTDLLDGFIARRLHQITRTGRSLDSSGDYIILGVASLALLIHKVFPLWFFIILYIRLLFQVGGLIYLRAVSDHRSPEPTFLGKASIFAVMTLLVFEICRVLQVSALGNPTFVSILEYIAGAILLFSLVDKVLYYTKMKKNIKEPFKK